MTIDRISKAKPYRKDNIQPLTMHDNVAKGNVERHQETEF
jgi:hypothetical protein